MLNIFGRSIAPKPTTSDALTAFELVSEVTGLEPGQERLEAYRALPEQLQNQIWNAALQRVQAQRQHVGV